MKEQEATDAVSAQVAARDRVLKEFEHTQTGLSAPGVAAVTLRTPYVVAPTASSSANGSATAPGASAPGVKRKFDLDSTEIERLTREGEDKAAKKIALELAESKKAKLPNFWLVRCFLSVSANPDQEVAS